MLLFTSVTKMKMVHPERWPARCLIYITGGLFDIACHLLHLFVYFRCWLSQESVLIGWGHRSSPFITVTSKLVRWCLK